jgi:hypothetical protein
VEAFISYVIQLHWLPFLGMITFAIIAFLEYRSRLGIFSPSGLTSLYAFIKFSAECLVIVNFTSLISLASIYGVSEQQYISQAILISFLVTSLSYIMLWKSSYSVRISYSLSIGCKFRKALESKYKKNTSRWLISRISFRYFVLFTFGLLLLLVIFQSAGGIATFLSNLAHRTEMLAGYGAVLKFSTLFIQLSILYFFSIKYKTSHVSAYMILLSGMLILFSLGGRTAPIFLLFTSLVYVHFYHKKFTITLRIFSLFSIIFIGSLFISLLRFENFESLLQMPLSELPFNLWFSTIGGYFTYIIRDSVIISYFSENEFWYGSGLWSFLYAFIPRALYPDKPVVDNGVYVIAMTTGQQVTPPMVPGSLPHYGWPEGYMSGYMEAGWIGLFLGVILSCYLVYFIFLRLVKSDFKIEWVFLYCFFIFRQPLYLTSIDLFNIIFHSIFVLGVGFLIRKKFVLKKN